jgi:hypothetical protein
MTEQEARKILFYLALAWSLEAFLFAAGAVESKVLED